ncbi:MAG: protein kinase [Prochloraceae cyanobacterium]|nr:protein kinase [Prochloraceae cyanobacterium]
MTVGKTIAGRYYIVTHLGGGAFGQTYIARDLQLPNKDHCLIKQLKPLNTDSNSLKAARRLFKTEAKVLNHLGTHPQIPRLLAYFEQDREFYLVEDFIEGKPLTEEIKPGKRWEESEVIDLLEEILQVLEFVHQQGVIHRDIKPANLMRRKKDGKIFLIDFGAVKQISTHIADAAQINYTVGIGTKGYMPPEQARGRPRLASDIYAVGAIAIQALTGIMPYELPENPKTGQVMWHDSSNISSELTKVLDKMVQMDFIQRYRNATEALAAIRNLKYTKTSITESSWRREFVIPSIAVVITATFGLASWILMPRFGELFQSNLEKPAQPEIINNLTYENPAYALKIKYPENWHLYREENPISASIARIAPKQSNSENLPEVIIDVENLNISLEQYTDSSITEIIENNPEVKIIDSRPTSLGENDGHLVIYTSKDPYTNLKIRSMQVWTLKHNRAYVITYRAEEKRYNEFFPPVRDVIINSLEIN